MGRNKERNGNRLRRKQYDKEITRLQARTVQTSGLGQIQRASVIVIFEGRDAAGKGGTIRAITERLSPRVFRVIALPAPSDREKSQM